MSDGVNAAKEAILHAIRREAEIEGQTPRNLLMLAEARAWLVSPAQPHGTGSPQ